MASLARTSSCRGACSFYSNFRFTKPVFVFSSQSLSSSSSYSSLTAVADLDSGDYLESNESVDSRVMRSDTINPYVRRSKYGLMLAPYFEMQRLLRDKQAGKSLPFDELIRCDYGDPQKTGQQPLTFVRQLLAACVYPTLLDHSSSQPWQSRLPADVEDKARRFLEHCDGKSIGAYGWYTGYEFVRKDIARYIAERDGYDCDWRNIFLTSGASDAMHVIHELLTHYDGRIGVLSPAPNFPRYRVLAAVKNLHEIPYYLNEENSWSLDLHELERAIGSHRSTSTSTSTSKCEARALVCINPGNPTGQVLAEQNIRDIIKFAYRHRLMIIADEVYHENVYGHAKFESFGRVLQRLGKPYSDTVQIASLNSASKGFFGECGLRAGYVEFRNFPSDVLAKIEHCVHVPSVSGQVLMYALANPPRPGDPSFNVYRSERLRIQARLSKNARDAVDMFNSTHGMRCNRVDGAMYAFPRVYLPDKWVAEANKLGREPDEHYCAELLVRTGVCVVPGCGFLQRPGTHHFRMTILPPEAVMTKALEAIKSFQLELMTHYS